MLLRANDNILKRFEKKHGKFFPPVIQREFLETMAMNILLEIKENIHWTKVHWTIYWMAYNLHMLLSAYWGKKVQKQADSLSRTLRDPSVSAAQGMEISVTSKFRAYQWRCLTGNYTASVTKMFET